MHREAARCWRWWDDGEQDAKKKTEKILYKYSPAERKFEIFKILLREKYHHHHHHWNIIWCRWYRLAYMPTISSFNIKLYFKVSQFFSILTTTYRICFNLKYSSHNWIIKLFTSFCFFLKYIYKLNVMLSINFTQIRNKRHYNSINIKALLTLWQISDRNHFVSVFVNVLKVTK